MNGKLRRRIDARRKGLAMATAVLLLGGCAENQDLLSFLGGENDEAAASEDPAAGTPSTTAEVADRAETPVTPVGGRTEWAGTLSAAAIDLTMTARDDRGWGILWQLVGDQPPGPLPAGTMAVGTFLGTRSTAGYLVRIDEVRVDPEGIVVRYVESPPAPDEMAAQVVTAPYAVTLVPANSLPVEYEYSLEGTP